MIAWAIRLIARWFGASDLVADDAAKLATDLRAQKATPKQIGAAQPAELAEPQSPYEGPNSRN